MTEQLIGLADVAERLRRRRLRAGSLDFDLPGPEVELDESGRPRDIRRAQRTIAHQAVEEAMLVANRAVAQ
ncbi:ribonuclease catalytic domain-containing protein, partial [Shewanella sp. C31]|nr:ribonuclease catalytic domain-containing protein [Shewanella electrica]